MGSKPPQTRKGTQGFPFQTLPHSAENGREKGGAGAPERNNKSVFLGRNIYGWKNLSRWINSF